MDENVRSPEIDCLANGANLFNTTIDLRAPDGPRGTKSASLSRRSLQFEEQQQYLVVKGADFVSIIERAKFSDPAVVGSEAHVTGYGIVKLVSIHDCYKEADVVLKRKALGEVRLSFIEVFANNKLSGFIHWIHIRREPSFSHP